MQCLPRSLQGLVNRLSAAAETGSEGVDGFVFEIIGSNKAALILLKPAETFTAAKIGAVTGATTKAVYKAYG